ncbi:MAG: ferric reductase-like transmembrane domain-containing protein [Pseudomonadota bacterium]
MRAAFIWGALALVLGAPIIASAFSPLLAWRQPVYIIASFAGIVALALMVLQPLLVSGALPGIKAVVGRRMHQRIGLWLVIAVVLHVGGLWVTSPPDVIDALLLVSPTPFSLWGVIAMWAIFVAAGLALLRRRLNLRWSTWRTGHVSLVSVAVAGTVLHTLLIEGTMQTATKLLLCAAVLAALIGSLLMLRRRRVPKRSTS